MILPGRRKSTYLPEIYTYFSILYPNYFKAISPLIAISVSRKGT